MVWRRQANAIDEPIPLEDSANAGGATVELSRASPQLRFPRCFCAGGFCYLERTRVRRSSGVIDSIARVFVANSLPHSLASAASWRRDSSADGGSGASVASLGGSGIGIEGVSKRRNRSSASTSTARSSPSRRNDRAAGRVDGTGARRLVFRRDAGGRCALLCAGRSRPCCGACSLGRFLGCIPLERSLPFRMSFAWSVQRRRCRSL